MFWIGFVMGAIAGAAIGMICMVLLAANNRKERNDKKQAGHFIEQKDRNEF